MNNKEKASAVLNYLEECDTYFVINILASMIDNEKFADLYDQMRADGIDI